MKNALQKIPFGYGVKHYLGGVLLFLAILSINSCTQEELENTDTLIVAKGLPTGCDIIGSQERFEIIRRSNGKIALRGSNGRYVSSENGNKAMTCNRTAIGAWELFDVVGRGHRKIALRGNNGRYVSSENGNKALTCNRTAIGAWEIFDAAPHCDSDGGSGGSGGDGGGSGNYSKPYDIPKFRNAIGKCKLQAPTSSTAATNSQLKNGYSSSWFKVADGNKIAFYQTGSSKRTELRFLNNWRVNSGNRTAHGNLKFISQAGDQATFMQIHDDANAGNGPNKPLLRMYRSKSRGPGNHIWAAVKTDSGGKKTTHIDCGPAPSGYFDCDISIQNRRLIVRINGSKKVDRSVSYWTFPSYWKAGVYNQNSGGTRIYFNELTWN